MVGGRFLMIGSIVLLLAGCNFPGQATPTVAGPNALRTIAARTVEAMSTQLAGRPTSPIQDTATPTPTRQVTQAPQVTGSPIAGTSTAPSCDQATFIRDVTVPDGTQFLPGTVFTKTWELKNSGTCPWTQNYALVFTNEGNLMGAQLELSLASGGVVQPGDSTLISTEMTSPAVAGQAQGFWILRNANGEIFGVGPARDKKVWVKIQVVKFGAQFFLIPNMCSAEWSNGSTSLACPGKAGDAKGAVYKVDNPKFSNGVEENEPVIVLEPQRTNNGEITGAYPPILVPANAKLHTFLGCAAQSPECNARIAIYYLLSNGQEVVLGEWLVKSGDALQPVDIDLVELAGKNMVFRFKVRANGSPTDDRIYILNPSIRPK